MTVEVPAEELSGVASTLRRHAVPEASDAEPAARAADNETDGLLHQGASGMTSAVAQKLQHALELCTGTATVTGPGDREYDVLGMTLDVGSPVPSEGDESRAALPVRVVAAR